MAINLSEISNAQTTALSLSNLVMATPQKKIGIQPQAPSTTDGAKRQNPPKFLFHYEGEQTMQIESEITDHYAEDNTTFQDHIALKPEIISTHGFIGELSDVAELTVGQPIETVEALKTVVSRLTAVSDFVPELSVSAQRAYNLAFQTYQLGSNIYDNIKKWGSVNSSFTTSEEFNKKLQTKQGVAFQLFYGYWRQRYLFTVQTPWGVFENMAIQSLRAVQDQEQNVITDFELTFKMMRFAETYTEISTFGQYDPTKAEGRTFSQGSEAVDLGSSQPSASDSLASKLAVA